MKKLYFLLSSYVLNENGERWDYYKKNFSKTCRMIGIKTNRQQKQPISWTQIVQKINLNVEVFGYPVFVNEGKEEVWGTSVFVQPVPLPIENVEYKSNHYRFNGERLPAKLITAIMNYAKNLHTFDHWFTCPIPEARPYAKIVNHSKEFALVFCPKEQDLCLFIKQKQWITKPLYRGIVEVVASTVNRNTLLVVAKIPYVNFSGETITQIYAVDLKAGKSKRVKNYLNPLVT